jgi:hypothetical protein
MKFKYLFIIFFTFNLSLISTIECYTGNMCGEPDVLICLVKLQNTTEEKNTIFKMYTIKDPNFLNRTTFLILRNSFHKINKPIIVSMFKYIDYSLPNLKSIFIEDEKLPINIIKLLALTKLPKNFMSFSLFIGKYSDLEVLCCNNFLIEEDLKKYSKRSLKITKALIDCIDLTCNIHENIKKSKFSNNLY